ncbi:hypothetical protein CC86DRAFT_404642 [Ophiobolus disseminans]|uniref:Uncharacterized protein n=1 Tax=Ophiobolus disseminans TaxID=1469910 RepID=A0A6A7A624_9PLEO|nr:hypothetical protein CC86DRAFT_404642 [Ophiobolus disseminans]
MEMSNVARDPAKPVPTSATSLIVDDENMAVGEALGLPEKRKVFSYLHASTVLGSLVCFAIGVVTITPSLGIAWRLRFSGQIVVLGFLLGVMNLCLQTVVPFALLLLEARHGQSRFQNFEAILLGRFITSKVSTIWRIVLLGLLALPLGLSVAYKRFLGGSASGEFPLHGIGSYGIGFPVPGIENWENDFLFTSLTSMAAFRLAVFSRAMEFSRPEDYPAAYGYNTLLLSNDAAAILDMPTMAYLTSLRSQLLVDETININASVYAYRATYNASTIDLSNEQWNKTIGSEILRTGALYSDVVGSRLGMLPLLRGDVQFMFGTYAQSKYQIDNADFQMPGDKAEFDLFKKRAEIFTIRRASCRGSWLLTNTNISLVAGSCSNGSVDSRIVARDGMGPFAVDTLPVLIRLYLKIMQDPDSRWLRSTYATGIATVYWARGLQMLMEWNEYVTYPAMNETLTTTRHILRADTLLYVVLFIQPALAMIAFAVAIWLHKVPIGENFGLLSILSGIDPRHLNLLRGAGLSGKVQRPVRLTIVTQPTLPNPSSSRPDHATERVRYYLKSETQGQHGDTEREEKARLIQGRTYT